MMRRDVSDVPLPTPPFSLVLSAMKHVHPRTICNVLAASGDAIYSFEATFLSNEIENAPTYHKLKKRKPIVKGRREFATKQRGSQRDHKQKRFAENENNSIW